MAYIDDYLNEATEIINKIDRHQIEEIIQVLLAIRKQSGRLFLLGVGGSAGNASHAVNDFRKLAGFETYAPSDNVSELTARTNDDGWHTVFVEWLKVSRLGEKDAILVLSVGGGNAEKNISVNLVHAIDHAKFVHAAIIGIVGRDGGYTATMADACLIIPTINPDTVTPHAESFQGVIWHLIVSDPRIKIIENKWESTK